MADNPTIIAASLSDSDLRSSIDKLVQHVEQGSQKMADSFDSAVRRMKESLGSINNVNINFGGGGSTNTKAIDSAKKLTQANKEVASSFDNIATAAGKSTERENVLTNYDSQIQKMIDRLKEVRQDIDIFKTAIGTGNKSEVEWGQKGLKEANAEAERLMRIISTLDGKRESLKEVMSPQGHSIQNFVQSLGKANPELAQLNEQFKRGVSLTQNMWKNHSNVVSAIADETQEQRAAKEAEKERLSYIKEMAGKIREAFRNGDTSYNTATMNFQIPKAELIYPENDARAKGLSIEEQIAALYEKEELYKKGLLSLTEEEIKKEEELAAKLNSSQKARGGGGGSTKDFDAFVAKAAGVSKEGLLSTSTEIKNMTTYLNQLTTAYGNLTNKERNSPFGNQLKEQIQDTTDVLKRLKREVYTPIDLNHLLNYSPTNLNDMVEKMEKLKAFRNSIDLTKPDAKQKIDEVDMAMRNLQRDMDKYSYKAKGILDTNNALGRSWNYMKNRLAFYFSVGASTQFIKNLMEVRSQYEMNERALGILINSAERGTKIFQELSNMALVSPYTLIELSSATKQLVAYDIAARDVVDTTRRLADMASAVGVPIERLTYALGQIKAYGYLNSRDARMFANAGIPLVKELAEHYTELEGKLVSTADVYDRIKKKSIEYNDVMQVINKMTDEGGKFFDFQAKMAGTLKVQLANLTLAWNNMLNDIGESEQGFLSGGIGLLKEFFLQWKNVDRMLKDLVITFGILKAAHLAYYGLVYGTNKAIALQTVLGKKLSVVLKGLVTSMNTALSSSATWWTLLAVAISGAVLSIMRGNEAMKQFNRTLREDAKSTFNDLENFSKQYSAIRDKLYKDGKPQDINKEEAIKAWEAVREQIELSSSASSVFIGKLMGIEDVSERLRQGFKIIDDIQSVAAALKELGDDTIKLKKDWSEWWNLWSLPDGTIENLKDAHTWLSKIKEEFGDLETAKAISKTDKLDGGIDNDLKESAGTYVENYEKELEKFRKDLDSTTQSILNFIELKGWSGNTTKIEETFGRITQKLALENNISPQELMTVRLETAQAEYNAIENALKSHINDENRALAKARTENEKADIESRLNVYKDDLAFLQNNTAQSRVYWEDFTKWMGEQHKSEVQAMFKGQSAEQIRMLDFSKGEYQKWVEDLAHKYADEHKMAYKDVYDQLHNYISNANQWSIRIPLIITSEGTKTEVETLKDADEAVDIALKNISRLKRRQKELETQGATRVKRTEEETEADKELLKVDSELAQNQKDLADAKAKGGHSKNEGKDANKKQREAEKKVTEAFRSELSILREMKSEYDKLRKSGVDTFESVNIVSNEYESTLKRVNKTLSKFGISTFDASDFAGKDTKDILSKLETQRKNAIASGKLKTSELKELDVEIAKLKVEAKVYDMENITKGLNSAFDNVKEEYELAVQLDASPMFGGVIADMLGVNKEDLNELPRTANEVMEKFQKAIDEKMQGTGKTFDLSKNLNKADFDKWVEENGQTLEDGLIKVLNKYREESNKVKLDEAKSTVSTWESLIEKYGDLQSKIIKIAKDTVEEQLGIIRQFGNEVEKSKALELVAKIRVSEDPAEIANLQKQLTELQSKIAQNNPKATQMGNAVLTGQARETSKTKWNDFVNSDMYSQTFEDMGNLGVRSLQLLKEKLNELKNDVKEDPASMKALMKQLEDVESELSARNPLLGISEGLKMIRKGSKEAKTGLNELNEADKALAQGQKELDEAKDAGDVEAIAAAQKKVSDATKKRTEAQKKVIDGENKQKKGAKNLTGALGNLSGEMQNVQGALSGVSKLLRQAGLDDEADAVDAINEGFSTMVTVIELATAAIIIMQSSCPYLLAIAAVLATIVGLVTFLSGQDNKKIDKEVKESELAVKQLEVTYVGLQHAIDKAYGASVSGAKLAMTGAKELELAEVQRQLRLEKSRKKKDRDQSKILELEKQIRELKYEILDSISEVTEALLGSDAGSFAESLVSDMIEAFKNGEDYMKIFSDKFDEMIDNMIMKSIVSRVVSQYIDQIWEDMDEKLNKRSEKERKEYADAVNKHNEVDDMTEVEVYKAIQKERAAAAKQEALAAGAREVDAQHQAHIAYERKVTKEDMEEYRERYRIAEGEKKKAFDAVTKITDEDIDGVMQQIGEIMPELGDRLRDILGKYYKFGESSDKELSALQQGISGITEETASAIEAYLNIVSQRIFEHGNLLTEIRDTLQGFNFEAQLGTQAEMLLQLQQSYSVQMAIQNILRGTLTPSGSAFMVELNS